jgi:hypothetical protein
VTLRMDGPGAISTGIRTAPSRRDVNGAIANAAAKYEAVP